MRFWDTSALVPLLIDEDATSAMRARLGEDPDVVVWMLTSVELLSTIGRLGRTSTALSDLLPAIRLDAISLFSRWLAVTHVADDHSVAGLAACISRALASPP